MNILDQVPLDVLDELFSVLDGRVLACTALLLSREIGQRFHTGYYRVTTFGVYDDNEVDISAHFTLTDSMLMVDEEPFFSSPPVRVPIAFVEDVLAKCHLQRIIYTNNCHWGDDELAKLPAGLRHLDLRFNQRITRKCFDVLPPKLEFLRISGTELVNQRQYCDIAVIKDEAKPDTTQAFGLSTSHLPATLTVFHVSRIVVQFNPQLHTLPPNLVRIYTFMSYIQQTDVTTSPWPPNLEQLILWFPRPSAINFLNFANHLPQKLTECRLDMNYAIPLATDWIAAFPPTLTTLQMFRISGTINRATFDAMPLALKKLTCTWMRPFGLLDPNDLKFLPPRLESVDFHGPAMPPLTPIELSPSLVKADLQLTYQGGKDPMLATDLPASLRWLSVQQITNLHKIPYPPLEQFIIHGTDFKLSHLLLDLLPSTLKVLQGPCEGLTGAWAMNLTKFTSLEKLCLVSSAHFVDSEVFSLLPRNLKLLTLQAFNERPVTDFRGLPPGLRGLNFSALSIQFQAADQVAALPSSIRVLHLMGHVGKFPEVLLKHLPKTLRNLSIPNAHISNAAFGDLPKTLERLRLGNAE